MGHLRQGAVWLSGAIRGLNPRSGLIFIQHIKNYLTSLFYVAGTILLTAHRLAFISQAMHFSFLAPGPLANYITSLGLTFLTCKVGY